MSDTMSAMSTKQYRPSSRSWIKLWVNEWLTSTVRWQLTPQQRSIWVDLLVLGGHSRFPGIICSGETNGVLEPFPMDYLCSVFRCTETDVQAAFGLFVAQDRITISETGVIRIVNWDKYQSEYQQKRQRRTYNEARRSDGQPNVRRKSKQTPPEEVEVEVEVEKKEKKKIQPASLAASEFRLFWEAWPVKLGEQKARDAWLACGCEGRLGEVLAALKDWQKTWTDPQFIPRAARWIGEGLWKENPHVAARKESLHEQLEKLGAKP